MLNALGRKREKESVHNEGLFVNVKIKVDFRRRPLWVDCDQPFPNYVLPVNSVSLIVPLSMVPSRHTVPVLYPTKTTPVLYPYPYEVRPKSSTLWTLLFQDDTSKKDFLSLVILIKFSTFCESHVSSLTVFVLHVSLGHRFKTGS